MVSLNQKDRRGIKYSYEEIKSIVEENGSILLSIESDITKGVQSKIRIICPCGNEYRRTFRDFFKSSNRKCKECRGKILGEKFKNSYDYVYQYYRDNGCELISKEYNNNEEILEFKCKCGEICKTKSFGTFQSSKKCVKCGIKSGSESKTIFNYEKIKEYMESIGCTLINEDANKIKDIVEFWCPKGHYCKSIFDAVWHNKTEKGYPCKQCGVESCSGENNYNWKGGYDYEYVKFRKTYEFKKWRKNVLERDKYTCQICKGNYKTFKNEEYLEVHHLNGYNWCIEERTEIDNGIALCTVCHKDFHDKYGKGNNTEEQFLEYSNERKVEKNEINFT